MDSLCFITIIWSLCSHAHTHTFLNNIIYTIHYTLHTSSTNKQTNESKTKKKVRMKIDPNMKKIWEYQSDWRIYYARAFTARTTDWPNHFTSFGNWNCWVPLMDSWMVFTVFENSWPLPFPFRWYRWHEHFCFYTSLPYPLFLFPTTVRHWHTVLPFFCSRTDSWDWKSLPLN